MSDDRSITLKEGKYELSKYWPDHTRDRSSRFRRVFASLDQAKAMRARIEMAIVLDTWRELRRVLTEGPQPDFTIAEFAPMFMEHVRKKNRRPDFHQEELDRKPDGILAVLGKLHLKEFRPADAARFERVRGKSVSAATVNRAISVLSYLLSYAVKCGYLAQQPMFRYGRNPEEQPALRILTMEEYQRFIAVLLDIDAMVGIYAGVMGEMALRPGEADRLEWTHIDFTDRILTVDQSKGKRARYLPISDFAVALLGQATRYPQSKTRRIFIRNTHLPIGDMRTPFAKAHARTGLDWVHPKHFRHFRATQWVRQGVDLKTVQELLGHQDIHTTMRYAHFAPKHAARTIVEAQRNEALSLRQLVMGFDRVQESGRRQDVGELERLYSLPEPTH
jgi:site-specific recombinase XerD